MRERESETKTTINCLPRLPDRMSGFCCFRLLQRESRTQAVDNELQKKKKKSGIAGRFCHNRDGTPFAALFCSFTPFVKFHGLNFSAIFRAHPPRKIPSSTENKKKRKKEDGREKQHDGTIKAFDRAENALPSKSSQERIEFRPHASLKNQPTGFTLSSFQFAEHGLTTINKKKKKRRLPNK